MRRLIATTILALSLLSGGAAAAPTADPRCEEDQPCWNCETMGNLRCGPVPTTYPAPYGPDDTVTPSEYAVEVCVEPQWPIREADGDRDLCFEREFAKASAVQPAQSTPFVPQPLTTLPRTT